MEQWELKAQSRAVGGVTVSSVDGELGQWKLIQHWEAATWHSRLQERFISISLSHLGPTLQIPILVKRLCVHTTEI